ncbi:MAG: hypothetical protein PHP01_03090, partial [Phycisphaerae bacterium]|nr:hypothetical protein [Phycisphaerae bacterium]
KPSAFKAHICILCPSFLHSSLPAIFFSFKFKPQFTGLDIKYAVCLDSNPVLVCIKKNPLSNLYLHFSSKKIVMPLYRLITEKP